MDQKLEILSRVPNHVLPLNTLVAVLCTPGKCDQVHLMKVVMLRQKEQGGGKQFSCS